MKGTFHGWVEILVPLVVSKHGSARELWTTRPQGALPRLAHTHGILGGPGDVTALRARVTSGQDIHVRVVVKVCRRERWEPTPLCNLYGVRGSMERPAVPDRSKLPSAHSQPGLPLVFTTTMGGVGIEPT